MQLVSIHYKTHFRAVPRKVVSVCCLAHSERIMGNASLQPDMKDESTDLQLEENFLKQLKDKYCSRVKVRIRSGHVYCLP